MSLQLYLLTISCLNNYISQLLLHIRWNIGLTFVRVIHALVFTWTDSIKYWSTPEESCPEILLESVTFLVIQCYGMITIVIIIFCLTLELLVSIPSVNFWFQKRLLIFVLFTVSEETDDICFIYSFSLLNMLPCLWDFHEPW